MKKPLRLQYLLAIILIASACQRDAEPGAIPPAPPPTEAAMLPAPATDAIDVTEATTPDTDAPRDFDARALAGTFEGEGTLVLAADGSYTFTLGEASDDGTWGPDGGDPMRLRFDPNDKSLQDRVLQVVSNDVLQPVEPDGAGLASGAPFERVASP